MFSSDEYISRRSRLLARMQDEKLDALVIFASKIASGHVRYYAGYESQLGILDCSCLIVIPGAKHEWTLVTNAFWDEPFGIPGLNHVIVTGDFAKTVGQLLRSHKGSVGVAPYKYFPAPVFCAIAESESPVAIRDVTELLLSLRAVKSKEEIEVLRQVAAIADRAGEAFLSTTRAGVSERDIAAEVEYSLRRAGSGPFVFSTILFSGPQTAGFIGLPGTRKLAEGDLVQLDCGPSLEGYQGDFARALCVGEPDSQATAMLETNALMYEQCLAALRPGTLACEVAEKVLGFAKREGFDDTNFYQSPNVKPGLVGHGIGLGNPDVPQLSTEDETVLAEGMVVNIETILRISGRGGTRIEDAAVLTKDGATRLSSCPIRLWQTEASNA